MSKRYLIGISILILVIILSGCSKSSGPVAVMEAYLNALTAKNPNLLSSLSCPEYAQESQNTLDSFTSVELSLEDVNCTEQENDGFTAFVKCSGKLTASYNGENMEVDLSLLTYQLQKNDGDWLICGQQ